MSTFYRIKKITYGALSFFYRKIGKVIDFLAPREHALPREAVKSLTALACFHLAIKFLKWQQMESRYA